MGAFVISPLPSFLLESLQTAGLRSTGITPLRSHYRPLRHPLVFPPTSRCLRLYGFLFSTNFSAGRGGFLQLLCASLSSCCRYNPARVSRRFSQSATIHVASPHEGRLGLWGPVSRPFLRSLSLRPDDSLTIRKMALSIGFQDSVPFLLAIQATGLWLLPW